MENLAPLASRLKPVVTKRAGLALALWGNAGIGKSYTAQRLLAAATCKSFSVHGAAPLGELVRVLPRPSRLPLWAERSLERLERGEQGEASACADALAALLAALAPVVLHLEDLHEAAPEQQGLWQTLAERVKRSRGVALLATSRTRPPEAFEAWRVEPLSEASSASLLAVKLATELPAEASAWIYKRAQGNPLFTLEYLRYLTRQGYLWNDLRHWRWREPPRDFVPVTVEALIESALEQATVSEAAKGALEAAAILPLDAPAGLWAALTGMTETDLGEAERVLERHGLFRDGAFAHPLFREVTRQRLSMARRRDLSRRALAALEGDPQKAAGFVEDAGLEPEEARGLLEKAAAQAEAGGNQVQAARFLAKAVNYTYGEDRERLALRAARELHPLSLTEAIRLAELVVDPRPDNREAVHLLTVLLAMQGDLTRAEGVFARLPQVVRNDVLELAHLVKLRATAGHAAAALELWQAHPELQALDDPELSFQIAFALNAQGEARKGLEVAQAALKHSQLTELMRARLLSACFGSQHYLGNYAAAGEFIKEALACARRMNSLRGTASCLFNLAYVHERLCGFKQRLAALEEALTLFGQLGDARMCAHAQVWIGTQHFMFGNPERAEEVMLESLALLGRLDVSVALIDCEFELSNLYLAWGPPHGKVLALKHAYAAVRYAQALDDPRSRLSGLIAAAFAETQGGAPQKGLDLAQEALVSVTSLDLPYCVCRALWAKGLALEALGQVPEALEALQSAQTLASRPGMGREDHEIGLEIDRLTGDLGSAREHVVWFEEHGLMYGVDRAHRYFPQLAPGEDVSPAQQPDSLPRLEVLGPMQVVHDGVSQSVRGHKRKELLARLLEARIAGRSEVTQLELFDSLYPSEPEDAAADSLKQLAFQLRKSLGAGAILRTTGGYALSSMGSDAEDFLESGDTRLWRGVYREDAGEGNETISSALYHALRIKAAERLDDNPVEAARLGRLLLQADPYDEEALRLTLKALRANDNHRALTRLYHESRKHLAEVGERLPERWADFLSQSAA